MILLTIALLACTGPAITDDTALTGASTLDGAWQIREGYQYPGVEDCDRWGETFCTACVELGDDGTALYHTRRWGSEALGMTWESGTDDTEILGDWEYLGEGNERGSVTASYQVGDLTWDAARTWDGQDRVMTTNGSWTVETPEGDFQLLGFCHVLE